MGVPSSTSYTDNGVSHGVDAGSGTWTCTTDPDNVPYPHHRDRVDTDPEDCAEQDDSGASIPSGLCYVGTLYLWIRVPDSGLSSEGTPATVWVSNLEATDTEGSANYGGEDDPGTGLTNNDVASTPSLAGRQHGWELTLAAPPSPGTRVITQNGDWRYRDRLSGVAGTFTGDTSSQIIATSGDAELSN